MSHALTGIDLALEALRLDFIGAGDTGPARSVEISRATIQRSAARAISRQTPAAAAHTQVPWWPM